MFAIALPFLGGIGLPELVIVAFMFLAMFVLPLVLVVFAVTATRQSSNQSLAPAVVPPDGITEVRRCAHCGSEFHADYDSCPYCARVAPAEATLDVIEWSTARVRALLVATIWPFVYAAAFFALAVGSFMSGTDPFATARTACAIGTFHIVTLLLSFALLVGYIAIAVMSPIESKAKVLWVVAIVLANPLANPFAFYFLVWKPRRMAAGSPGRVGDLSVGMPAPAEQRYRADGQEVD